MPALRLGLLEDHSRHLLASMAGKTVSHSMSCWTSVRWMAVQRGDLIASEYTYMLPNNISTGRLSHPGCCSW